MTNSGDDVITLIMLVVNDTPSIDTSIPLYNINIDPNTVLSFKKVFAFSFEISLIKEKFELGNDYFDESGLFKLNKAYYIIHSDFITNISSLNKEHPFILFNENGINITNEYSSKDYIIYMVSFVKNIKDRSKLIIENTF
jgi:hypothetical protein